MSARTELAAQLAQALPEYKVVGFNTEIDPPVKPTVMLWASGMRRYDTFGNQRVLVSLDLWVLSGKENPSSADDALDEALEDVLGALAPLGWVEWSEAERGVFADRLHGWRVSVSAVADIIDNTEEA